MKSKNTILGVAVTSFFTLLTPAWVAAQPQKLPPVHYHITDLGTLGGPFSEATSVASDGLISGAATLVNGTQHATLWFKGLKLDLGTPGFDAKNSAKLNSTGFTTNDFAQVVGVAEVSPSKKTAKIFAGSAPASSACLSFGRMER